MTWIDAVIVIVFLFFIVTAIQRGVHPRDDRHGVGGAGVRCWRACSTTTCRTRCSTGIDNQTTSAVVAFLIIFFGVTIAGQLLAMLVHPAITVLQLGIFDQLLGAGLGALKAFVIVEIMLILFVTYPRYDLDEKINDSQFASVMLDASQPILKILPEVFDSEGGPVQRLRAGSGVRAAGAPVGLIPPR